MGSVKPAQKRQTIGQKRNCIRDRPELALLSLTMDALAGLLDGPRARSAFLLRSIVDPPWSMRIEDQAPLTVLAMVRGDAWVLPDGGDPVRIAAGDVAIFRGPDLYTVADDPGRAPHVVIHPGQVCEVLEPAGEALVASMAFGVRTWGNAFPGQTEMLTGTYQLEGEVSGRLLRALPALLVLRGAEWDCPVMPLLAAEIVKDDPGQETVLDRLLDLLLIASLRAWFTRPETSAPTWYQAHSDPVVGRALRLMHHNPAHPWTVSELARETAISRAAFARRFQDLVGEPPVAFLTGWRIALAADLLREPGATLTAVAHQVGYGSPFALSAAFKRLRGVSPQQYMRREQQRAAS
jgi:AraC-like DNA-binding protein